MRIVPAGPNATYLDLDLPAGTGTSDVVGRLLRRMSALPHPGVEDVVAGFTTVLIEHRAGLGAPDLEHWIRGLDADGGAPSTSRRHEIPVAYGVGVDVAEVEARVGRPFHEIVSLHAGHLATVAFVGFTPGFPYLLGLPEALAIPRRRTPLHRIEAGTVAIADGRTGIYPSPSPGGWWAVGKTSVPPFDPCAHEPALFQAGDTVAFVPVPATADGATSAPVDRRAQVVADDDQPIADVVHAVPGSASLQGPPRRWVGRLGVASGGVLDPTSWETMHTRIDMGPEGVVLELLGQPLVARALRTVTALVGGGGVRVRVGGAEVPTWRPFTWTEGSELRLEPSPASPGRVAMLGVGGGFAADAWLGSRSTDVRAGAGGCGRWLAPGDRLWSAGDRVADLPTHAPSRAPTPDPWAIRPTYPPVVSLRLHPGPQFEPDAWHALTTGTFRVGAFDRTGMRLTGSPVGMHRHEVGSEGVPLGAVQVPPDGQPIVLLADRGRTGGYAKPAVVDRRDLGRLAQANATTEIRFVPMPGRA